MVGFSNSINILSSLGRKKIAKNQQCKNKDSPGIQSGGGKPLPQRAIAKKRKPQIEIKKTKPKSKKKKH